MKLGAKQLRVIEPTQEQLDNIKRKPLYIVLDNVLDTYNIGSIYRLADAVAAKEVILCGGSQTPPSSRIHKSAIGTEKWVPWRYFKSTKEALEILKKENLNLQIIAVEQDKRSITLNSLQESLNSPVAVVVGHETEGVSRDVLDVADVIVEIPMYGVNISLNVHVSATVVIYKLLDLI